MASLLKRGRSYYVVFSVTIDGNRSKVKQSLGIRNYREAKAALNKINVAEASGALDPLDQELNVKRFLNRKERQYGLLIRECIPLFLQDHPTWEKGTHTAYETILWNWWKDQKKTLVMAGTKRGATTFLNENHVRDFLNRPDITNATRRKELRHIKRFCNWLIMCQETGKYDTRTYYNPCKYIEIEAIDVDYDKKMITETEMCKVVEAWRVYYSQDWSNKPGKNPDGRPWFPVLMWAYFYTGCRRAELLDRKIKHIKRNEFLKVVGKRKRIRNVVLKPELQELMTAYILTLPSQDPEQYLFPNPANNMPLAGETVYRAFKFFLDRAKLPKTRTIHGIRHHSVTQDIRDGIPLSYVRDQHGHSTIKTTEIYEHLAAEDRKTQYLKKRR